MTACLAKSSRPSELCSQQCLSPTPSHIHGVQWCWVQSAVPRGDWTSVQRSCVGPEADEQLLCRQRPFIKDPTSLIPQLPKPQDLRPFPYKLLLRFLGHKGSVCSLGLHAFTACTSCASADAY